MPRAQGVRGGGTSIPLLSGSCLPMVLPSQPGWGAQGMEVGTLGQARKRKAGAPGSEPPGPGFPPLSSSGRGGGCSASVSPSAWGKGGSHLRERGKWGRGRRGTDRYQHPSTSPRAKLRPEPSAPQRRRPGRRFPAPRTVLRPRRSLGWARGSRGAPPRLTKAQAHLGSRAGSPRPAQRGSGGCGRPGGSAPIPVGGRRAPASAPRPLPAGSPGSPAPLPVTPRAALPREGPGGRLASGPVRPAGPPFLARPAESRHWPHPHRLAH